MLTQNREYQNGAGTMAQAHAGPYAVEAPAKEGWFSKLDQFKGWITPIVVVLVAGGWLLIPAKDRDVKDLAAKVEAISKGLEKTNQSVDALATRVEHAIEKIGAKIDKLQESTQANREEIIRLTVSQASAPVPAAVVPPDLRPMPAKPVRTTKVRPKVPPKSAPVLEAAQKPEPTFLQKLLQ